MLIYAEYRGGALDKDKKIDCQPFCSDGVHPMQKVTGKGGKILKQTIETNVN